MKSIDIDIEKLKELVLTGLKLKSISIEMGVSLSTVKRILAKLSIGSNFYSIKKEYINCLECGVSFIGLKSDIRKFCSKSCSALYNNSKREKREKKKKPVKTKRIRIFTPKKIGICLNCNGEIIRSDGRIQGKFCSTFCHKEYEENLRFEKLKYNGDVSNKTAKLYLIKTFGNKCMRCGWCEVNEKSGNVPIELEHIDGNSGNNILDNLKLLCPNCHSLTPTYKALNKGNGRHKRMERYNDNKSY